MNSSTNWFVKTTSTALYAQRSKSKTTEFVKYTFLKFFFTKINELWTLHKSKFTSYLKPWGWFKCWNQLTHWFLMFWSVFKSNSYFFSNICILIIKPLFANTPCMFNVWKKNTQPWMYIVWKKLCNILRWEKRYLSQFQSNLFVSKTHAFGRNFLVCMTVSSIK